MILKTWIRENSVQELKWTQLHDACKYLYADDECCRVVHVRGVYMVCVSLEILCKLTETKIQILKSFNRLKLEFTYILNGKN